MNKAKKMNTWKKIVSVALVATMCISMFPKLQKAEAAGDQIWYWVVERMGGYEAVAETLEGYTNAQIQQMWRPLGGGSFRTADSTGVNLQGMIVQFAQSSASDSTTRRANYTIRNANGITKSTGSITSNTLGTYHDEVASNKGGNALDFKLGDKEVFEFETEKIAKQTHISLVLKEDLEYALGAGPHTYRVHNWNDEVKMKIRVKVSKTPISSNDVPTASPTATPIKSPTPPPPTKVPTAIPVKTATPTPQPPAKTPTPAPIPQVYIIKLDDSGSGSEDYIDTKVPKNYWLEHPDEVCFFKADYTIDMYSGLMGEVGSFDNNIINAKAYIPKEEDMRVDKDGIIKLLITEEIKDKCVFAVMKTDIGSVEKVAINDAR